MTLGFHFQEAVPDWPQAVALLPDGAVVKSVEGQHILRDIKAINPKLFTVYRKIADGHQDPSVNYEANLGKARAFFTTFIDGTFWDQKLYLYMDAVEEWNEYASNSWSAEDKAKFLSWCKAVNWVWTYEYRFKNWVVNGVDLGQPLKHIRLVSCNTAIGNSIPWEFAEVVQRHDGLLGYHNYVHVPTLNTIDPGDADYHSGRWRHMDAEYRGRGITVNWIFTEGGAYNSVFNGWKHPTVYDGNLNNYINGAIKHVLDINANWNAQHNNRAIGGVLFTVMRNGWEYFNMNTGEMKQIAQFVKDYAPGPVPPPVTDWMKRAWNYSVQHQIDYGIHVNPQAGLTQAIEADEMRIVDNEISFEGRVFQAAETYDGSRARRLYVYEQGKPVWWYNDPS